MAKLTGVLQNEGSPFSGSLMMTALNGTLEQYNIADGVPTAEINILPGYYNVQMVPAGKPKTSSYPQYKWRVPDAKSVDFDKIEIEPLA